MLHSANRRAAKRACETADMISVYRCCVGKGPFDRVLPFSPYGADSRLRKKGGRDLV